MITLGIDIGSTTSKCVLLRDGKEILAHALLSGGIGTDGPERAYQQALREAGLEAEAIAYQTATGYGRNLWPAARSAISELSAHALGCYLLQPEAGTIIDIGGQDAKVIRLDDKGLMQSFVMNDKCAAGTGRFLEVMAGVLQVDIGELGNMAEQSRQPVSISSTCTVFAESEVISQLAAGANRNDVVAGICASVAGRVAALARRAGLKEKVCLAGGVALNDGVRRALSGSLGVEVHCARFPQINGALGAAVSAYQKAAREGRDAEKE